MRSAPPGKLGRESPARLPLLRVGAVRGVAEALALSVVLGFGSYLATGSWEVASSRREVWWLHVLTIGPMCAILCALRTRLRAGSRPAGVLASELATGAAFAVLVTAPVAVLQTVRWGTFPQPRTISLVLAWNLAAFAFFRTLAYLWPRWTRLRRSRLRWDMTHTIALAVVGFASALILAFAAYSTATSDLLWPADLPGQLGTLLPRLGILIFLSVVILIVVLPPAAAVSYFAARRTARRLEALAHGTGGLRQGNFGVRVEVDGEDEVSELQRDFNAMADDLGSAVRDLRSERDNVRRLLRAQRELVASVSHELRTPVATMRGYLESALNGEDDRVLRDLRDDLEVVERETVRLQRLIDDLFVLSRTEAGQLPLQIGPTDVNALLSRCATAVSGPAWRTGKVEVVFDPVPNLPAALADGGRLEQAVRNLLSNAVRHTPPGGIVGLGATAEPDAIAIEVKDTGEGIVPEEIDRVFERFYRSDGARELDRTGAGLGLALVRELTEAMSGSVSAESEPGSGSRFTLRLPRA